MFRRGGGRGLLGQQAAEGTDQTGEGGTRGGGIGLGAAGEGFDHQLGSGVDHGPLVAGQGLDHGSGLVPEALEATHGGDRGGEIAAPHFAFALVEQVEHGRDSRRERGLTGVGGGLLGGLAGGVDGVLGGILWILRAAGEGESSSGRQGQATAQGTLETHQTWRTGGQAQASEVQEPQVILRNVVTIATDQDGGRPP